MDYTQLLQRINDQEEELQFSGFTNETALQIGLLLVETAKKENKSITIDITRSNQQLFHYSFAGTSPDNDQWVLRKNRVVNRFLRSSFYYEILLKSEGKTAEEKLEINHFEYATHGGAFPIILKNSGVIGTITVSGLRAEEDHEMVVKALKTHLGK